MRFVALVLITSADHEDKLKKIAKEAGGGSPTVLQGRGSGQEEKKSFFSLTFEGNQSILLFILEDKLSRSVLKTLNNAFEEFKSKSVAFTIPITHIVGLDKNLLSKFQESIKNNEEI